LVNEGWANGYVLKSSASPRHYLEAMRFAKEGQKYFTPDVLQLILESKVAELKLSSAEWTIFYMLLADKNIKEIAAETGIHESSVRRSLEKIKKHTGANGNISLMRYAVKNHLLSTEMIQSALNDDTDLSLLLPTI
jgi:DNA-binding NarL/FixJ family response regulator